MTSEHIKSALNRIKLAKEGKLSSEMKKQEAIALALDMLQEGIRTQTHAEKKEHEELDRMMSDPNGKTFTTQMTDQCFRSNCSKRAVNQLSYLMDSLGIPKYLGPIRRLQLKVFRIFAPFLSSILMPIFAFMLRKQTSSVILPGEKRALSRHMKKRRKQGVRINLNHLGEAILGEKEAIRKLNMYLEDLSKEDVEYVSIKISTIFSQIHLLGWETSLDTLSERLRQLYRACLNHHFKTEDGTKKQKFVNLDMEEYRDLHLTKELFKRVLSEPEFLSLSAGIVLQAYLPDCFLIQKELTEWSLERVSRGGAPIKIRIVKGANLAMEQVESSLRGWAQAPYKSKEEVDANYKKMITYGCKLENATAVNLGVGSHNLFDIAYAMLLRAENNIEKYVTFEMLEGMTDHTRRVVQTLTQDILLYCPVSTKEDFQSAIAYLIRRLDENTGEENFLRYTFGLKPGSQTWEEQAKRFSSAYDKMDTVFIGKRKNQNRAKEAPLIPIEAPFENEADTDFSEAENRNWAYNLIKEWSLKEAIEIPCVIGGEELHLSSKKTGFDPSFPGKNLYTFSLASWKEVDQALAIAKEEEASWRAVPAEVKASFLAKAAKIMRDKKKDLIGVMIADCGKTVLEADPEVSEAIDFAEYYLRSLLKMHSHKELQWEAKGTVLVTPPWNFPVAIPAGGILSALAAGNCVLFKPAPEAVLSGWVLVNALWEAGIPKRVLQFINCEDDPVGSQLITDSRINVVILTGATSTAKLFLKMRPDLDLLAETGGKNALIITSLSDRDLAIKELIQSAFGHGGQKCSAASLAILEAEVYDDPHFRKQLKDAAESIKVGSSWNLDTKVPPLCTPPSADLKKSLTSLEDGESWLVEPKSDENNPNLWSPGIKLGVKPGSFMHTTEFFGPIVSLMRAENLKHAVELANATSYGLTSGIISLDQRELAYWIKHIEAGNLYINRSTTGAIVQRQPFGGCKASSFGPGIKAGGPHYVAQLAHAKQIHLPEEKTSLPMNLSALIDSLEKVSLSQDELSLLYGSLANYAFAIRNFPLHYDLKNPQGLSDLTIGQDNALFYVPRKNLSLRIQKADLPIDILRVIGACIICETPLAVSFDPKSEALYLKEILFNINSFISLVEETEDAFLDKLSKWKIQRVRLLSPPSEQMKVVAAKHGFFLDCTPVLASGYFELVRYVREVAISYDYHRYGSLGLREGEPKKPIL